MEKTIIQVPKGIRYISDFEKIYGFHLEEFPYILDKKLPGCGFTTWVLTNSQNIILASPRKVLMENKKDQLGEEVFLVDMQQFESEIDRDLTKVNRSTKPEEFNIDYDRSTLIHDLSEYILKRQLKNLPIKIIVTYDSYRKIKEYLVDRNIFQEFYTITDECQSIFCDSKFKSSTEMEFLDTLLDVQRVCYVSATPMMEEYLELIDYFRDLPYFELDWETQEPSRIKKPKIIPRTLKSVNLAAKSIISPYLEGKFESKLHVDKKTGQVSNQESKEAVIYVNSVSNIIGIIKACNLKPEDVTILCSDTPNNRKRIKNRLNKKRDGIEFKIGKVPLPGEPRKMFTFCTRTVYLGADFYSDNARTFIISDANIDTLAVDITLDLPQILGRQRLTENPWKDEAVLYVKPLMRYKATTEEEFIEEVNKKLQKTKDILDSYEDTREEARDSMLDTLEKYAVAYNYQYDYIAINHHSGSKPVPVFNTLVAIAEKRAFDIQQKDYSDRFTVLNQIVDEGFDVEYDHGLEVQSFLDKFHNLGSSKDKLKLLCSEGSILTEKDLEVIFREIPDYFRNFYLGLGPDRCRALGYEYTRMKKEYDTKFFDTDTVKEVVFSKFSQGDKLSSLEIKSTLKDLYSELGYKKTPKASDLEEYFELKKIKTKDQSGKWVNGFELLKKKL